MQTKVVRSVFKKVSFSLIILLLSIKIYHHLLKKETTDIDQYQKNLKVYNEELSRDQSTLDYIFTAQAFWKIFATIDKKLEEKQTTIFFSGFINFFLLAYQVTFKKNNLNLFSLLILLHPLFFDFCFAQIRNSFAYLVFFTAFNAKSDFIKLVLFTISIFFHFSIVILCLLLCLIKINEKILTGRKRSKQIYFFILLSCSVFALLDVFLNISSSNDGKKMITLWLLSSLILLILNKNELSDSLQMFFLLILISFISNCFGLYSTRFISMSIPFLGLKFRSFSARSDSLKIISFLGFNTIPSFLYWL